MTHETISAYPPRSSEFLGSSATVTLPQQQQSGYRKKQVHAGFATPFDALADKLERNVYGSTKGAIRLQLLMEDIEQNCPDISGQPLSILDVGGGSGRMARRFAQLGHHVLLCDSSIAMLEKAAHEIELRTMSGKIELLHADFLSPAYDFYSQFNIVLLHGSAEWMSDPDRAIIKACRSLKPGGYLSLLIFNKDRLLLKKGINGHLLDPELAAARTRLTPPGARSFSEIADLLSGIPGKIIQQSGIRIFHGFFRQICTDGLTVDQWIAQEKLYYRQPPFCSLGEHTHVIWQKGSPGTSR